MKKFFAITLALLMVLSLVACGSTTESVTDNGEEVSVSATPTLDAIKEKGKLVVMTNASFPPFEYIDAQGKVVGIDLELAQKVADTIGVEMEVADMDFDLLIDALKNGKGDLVASGVTVRPDRAEIVDFTTAYIAMGLKVIVPVGTDIKTFDDLDGKKIAVQESTTSNIYAQENYKNAEILAFKSAIDAGNAVKSGNADCAIMDILPAEYMTANSPEIELMEDLLSAEDIAMCVAKGHEDLLSVVNEVLETAMADGSLDASFEQHMTNFSMED